MPKYNLMDNLDPDKYDPSKESKEAEEKEPVQKPEADADQDLDDTKLSDYIMEDMAISEPEIRPSEDIKIDPGEETASDFTDQQRYSVPDGTPPMQPYHLESDYEDQKQPGLNFKPLFIGLGIIIGIVIIYFAVTEFILGDSSEPDQEIVQETPEEKMLREREEQKQNFFLTLNNNNNKHLAYLSALIDMNPTQVKYSSFLLYNNSLNFEVFASDRDQLAAFNVKLKNNNNIKNYKIESAVNRPGSRGGVFALYDVDMAATPGNMKAAASPAQQISPTDFVTNAVRKLSLEPVARRRISSRSQGQFTVEKHEIILNGAQNNCNNLIKLLYIQNANIGIHKMTLLPKNQRDMQATSYELRLILDFYL